VKGLKKGTRLPSVSQKKILGKTLKKEKKELEKGASGKKSKERAANVVVPGESGGDREALTSEKKSPPSGRRHEAGERKFPQKDVGGRMGEPVESRLMSTRSTRGQ